MITLILALASNMKCMMTLTISLIPLTKILDIIYIYIFISEPTNGEKYIVKGNNIFICQRMSERGGLFRAKVI